MSLGKTSILATFCISVNHPKGYMDENAIKAIFEAGQRALANETLCLRSIVICDGPDPANPDKDDDRDGCEDIPSSVAVKVTDVRIEGKRVNLKNFGTDAVPLKTWTQTEYHF